MYIKRHLEEQILQASQYYPVVMVCGARQVGKSTMLNHIREEDRHYVTLDDYDARHLALTDPALFFETYGYPLLIDEFQRVPSLLLEMKKVVDARALAGEDNSGMFWLTGSQKFTMMQNVSESLAGRIAVFEMSSLSSAEIEGRPATLFDPDISALKDRFMTSVPKDVHGVYSDIFQGGMPKLRTTDLDRDRYFMDYVNTYIERDIKALSQVGKLNEFNDFLVCMAARTGQELKYEDIASTVGISSPTAKAWVAILERSGLIYILRPYYSNITKRLVKTPKCYFMDTGLAAYLCQWPNVETLESGAANRAFFETYAISEIVKSYYNAGKEPHLYYYRDTDRKEIDLLVINGEKLYPIEIKKATSPCDPDKNLNVLSKLNLEVQPEVVLCMNDKVIPYNRQAWYCPITVL